MVSAKFQMRMERSNDAVAHRLAWNRTSVTLCVWPSNAFIKLLDATDQSSTCCKQLPVLSNVWQKQRVHVDGIPFCRARLTPTAFHPRKRRSTTPCWCGQSACQPGPVRQSGRCPIRCPDGSLLILSAKLISRAFSLQVCTQTNLAQCRCRRESPQTRPRKSLHQTQHPQSARTIERTT